MRIGERVLLLAEQKGIKRVQLAQSLGIGKSTVTGWEQKNRNPSSELIVPICELLGVSPYLLLTGEEKVVVTQNGEEEKLLTRYHALDEDGKEIVRAAALYELRRMQQGNSSASIVSGEEVGQGATALLVSSQKAAAPGINKPKAPPGQPPKPKKQAQ